MTELLRHALALQRARDGHLVPTTLYEKRLVWMGSPQGYDAFRSRIAAQGSESVPNASLILDREARVGRNSYSIFYQVALKDHPKFIGGEVERLCL